MGNIWGFLLQTVTVSFVAALLLTIKSVLRDNLSPRWQYGVWGLLALRIIVPVNVGRYILLPINFLIENLKGSVESGLASAYSAVYEPIKLKHVLPTFGGSPRSVTDWLLIIYAAGIVLYLLWHIVSYTRLRFLLRRGEEASTDMQRQIAAVCERYGLKSCRTVVVDGLPSAFICGVINPVLVLPSAKEIDDKVLLHELLHLKHHDALQSIIWCVLRSLQWCNPLMIYVFNRIGNDMESLCDQRVLELLEGEDRREYGKILLGMANERYARAPGTSSISNGGENISRRIDAIVRFKKYPRGMALVSVCIIVVLLSPVLVGTANAYSASRYEPENEFEFRQAMATARINRCTTMAAAIDTYTKGLMFGNGIYIATASPLSSHEALEAEMRANPEGAAHYYEYGMWLESARFTTYYELYNIKEEADGRFSAVLEITSDRLMNEDGSGTLCDAESHALSGKANVPLSIWYDDAWVVEESGEREFIIEIFTHTDPPMANEITVPTETGTITLGTGASYYIGGMGLGKRVSIWGVSVLDKAINLEAQFDSVTVRTRFEYFCAENDFENKPGYAIGMKVATLDSPDEVYDFEFTTMTGSQSGSSTDGTSWTNTIFGDNWDGTAQSGYGNTYYEVNDVPVIFPPAYKIQIFWDGKAVEEFVLEGVQP